jgi:transaldolase
MVSAISSCGHFQFEGFSRYRSTAKPRVPRQEFFDSGTIRPWRQIELIWASPRELLNVFHADSVGCHVITVTADVLKKLELVGKDLDAYSTVKMFYDDATRAGYTSEGGTRRSANLSNRNVLAGDCALFE